MSKTFHGVPFSRRTFLRSSAAAAAFPMVGGLGRAIPKSDPDVLKVGLIGCGGRGSGAANQAIHAESGTVVLTAMADVFEDRLESSLKNLKAAVADDGPSRVQVDEDHKFVGFDAYKQLIDSDVDVVILTTPPHFRPMMLEYAIAKGKHVFCEKPMAVDGPGVRRVLAAAKAAKEQQLALVAGFCWRYNAMHQGLFGRINEGHLGDVQSVYTTYNASPLGKHSRKAGWTDMEWQLRNWQHILWIGGDHLVEQACHSLDKMGWAFGDVAPLSVTGVGGRAARTGLESGNIFDHFGLTYDYPNGAKGFHMSRQISGCSNENMDYVWGTKGRATCANWGAPMNIEGENSWEYEGPGNDMYQHEHDELFASIRAGTPINDGEWMGHSTLLAVMGRMAAYTGQTVTWDQALNSEESLGPPEYRWGWVGMRRCAIPGKTKLI